MRFRFGCFLFDLKSFCHFSRLHSSLCALKNWQKIQSNQFKNQLDRIYRTHLKLDRKQIPMANNYKVWQIWIKLDLATPSWWFCPTGHSYNNRWIVTLYEFYAKKCKLFANNFWAFNRWYLVTFAGIRMNKLSHEFTKLFVGVSFLNASRVLQSDNEKNN